MTKDTCLFFSSKLVDDHYDVAFATSFTDWHLCVVSTIIRQVSWQIRVRLIGMPPFSCPHGPQWLLSARMMTRGLRKAYPWLAAWLCITARGLHEAGPWLAETRLSIWPWGVRREGLLNYLKYPLWHSLDFLIRDIPTPTIYDLVLMQFIFLAWDARVRSILSLQRTG